MSTKFIPNCFTVIYGSDGKGVIDNSINKNKNFLLLKELHEAHMAEDLEKYIKLYSQYIDDTNIYDYHVFSEYSPHNFNRIFYPGCTCNNKNDDSLVMVHKGRYEQPCNCVGGKRYLALRNAYEIELKKQFNEKCCLIFFSIDDLFKYFKCDINTFVKSDIINYIESTGDVDLNYTAWM